MCQTVVADTMKGILIVIKVSYFFHFNVLSTAQGHLRTDHTLKTLLHHFDAKVVRAQVKKLAHSLCKIKSTKEFGKVNNTQISTSQAGG